MSFALYIGITFVVLKIFGSTYPVSIDLLIRMLRGSQILSFILLRNDVLMPSCPQNFREASKHKMFMSSVDPCILI